jgi:arabinofuranan 3-O-arabinosyltransferase
VTARPALRRAAGGGDTAPTPAGPRLASGGGWPAPGLRWFLLVWLVALIVLAANHPGQLAYDTKLGVDIDPAGFFARLWDLWDPLAWLGTLQDQYIGYAFPMAPFYLISHAIGGPAWLTERLWMSLLVATGFAGLARLAAALRIGSPRTRLLAGLAFALWPTFTILVGSSSASILPGIMAPWAVLPLVAAAAGRTPVIRAAARSGVAVLGMGGVNAAVTAAALIAPALFIVLYARGRRRIALGGAWAVAVILATAWWAGPLLLQGRYAFSFLPYIEQAAITTRTMSAAAALLGTGDWTAYFNPGTPWNTAGWTLISSPAAVLAGTAAAAAGLAGLARRDLPHAAWLRLAAGLAAAGALAGYWGPLAGPFHGTVDSILNGVLAPLRNVYKLESVLALVLALGLAHGLAGAATPAGRAVGQAVRRLQSRRPGPRAGGLLRREPSARRDRAGAAGPGGNPGPAARSGRASRPAVVRVLAAGSAAVVLAGLALPYLTGQVLNPGAFTAVPRYWSAVAGFLAAHSPREPAFVVPGDAHGEYLWGSSLDDPLEPLARSPWVERGLVPYGGAGSQDFVNTAESAVESGQQVPGLPAYLARAGVRYVVVRNDLSPAQAGYTAPQVVHATLAQSGFRRVAAFGPRIPVTPPGAAAALDAAVLARLPGAAAAYPAVEVYAAAGRPAAGPAQVQPASQAVLVDGGPGSLLPLAGQGVLDGRPVVVAGTAGPPVPRPAARAVTDGARRADTVFGLISGNVSETYTATQVNPPDEQLGDQGGPPRQLAPVPARLQTVAVLSGAAAVTASSVGSWVTEAPQYDPVNAFDRNAATAWTVGVPRAAGQWLQVSFGRRRVLPARAGIRLLTDLAGRPVPSRVTVSTAAGRMSTVLRRTGAVQPLAVPPGPTRWLRVTIAAATRPTIPGISAGLGAGISDVLIPGVQVRRLLRPARDPAGRDAAVQVLSFAQQLPSPALLASPAAYPPLARAFSTAGPAPLRMTATAMALPGRALTALLQRLTPAGPGQVQVTATSTLGSLPSLAPAQLLARPASTRSAAGPWIAASAHPVLSLSWTGDRRIADLTLAPDPGVGAFPQRVTITSPAGVRTAAVGFGGLVTLSPPLVTDQLSIGFPASEPASAAAAAQRGALPIALGRLTIPALAGLHAAVPDPAASFRLPCGLGPALTIDGRTYPTAVAGQVSDLTTFRPVQVRLCAPQPVSVLTLPAGAHQLIAATPNPFALTSLALTSATGPAASPAGRPAAASRALRVTSWQADRRSLRVAAGAASYLELHQNANPGWTATLNGRRLAPATLDGWQQGYVLPAGRGGMITLAYAPDRLYHWLLAAAALGVLVLLAAAWPWPRRTAARRPTPDPGPGCPAVPQTAGPAAWAGVAAVAALIFAVGGPVAAVVPVLAALAWWRPGWRPAVAAVAIAAAGVITATAGRPDALGSGAFSAAAQACALTALAAALLPAPPCAGRRRRPG